MTYRANRRRGRNRLGEFRPRSLTQHRAPRTIKPSAREWHAANLTRLLASRPVMHAPHPHLKDRKGKPLQVASYGPPTFRNVIDAETGAHV